jgi:hypothetical protein
MDNYYYECIHIPTGKHFINSRPVTDFNTVHDFISIVMDWNTMRAGEFQYWCNVRAPSNNPRWNYDEVKELRDGTLMVGAK